MEHLAPRKRDNLSNNRDPFGHPTFWGRSKVRPVFGVAPQHLGNLGLSDILYFNWPRPRASSDVHCMASAEPSLQRYIINPRDDHSLLYSLLRLVQETELGLPNIALADITLTELLRHPTELYEIPSDLSPLKS